jgi:hypothetical protein
MAVEIATPRKFPGTIIEKPPGNPHGLPRPDIVITRIPKGTTRKPARQE